MRELTREFTKSVLRFSWSLSLFGAQQMMINILEPESPEEPFNNVTEEAANQLGENLMFFYRTGNQLGGHIVDRLATLLTDKQDPDQSWDADDAFVANLFKVPNEVLQWATSTIDQAVPQEKSW